MSFLLRCHSWLSPQRSAKEATCQSKGSQDSGVADGCSTASTHQTTLKVPTQQEFPRTSWKHWTTKQQGTPVTLPHSFLGKDICSPFLLPKNQLSIFSFLPFHLLLPFARSAHKTHCGNPAHPGSRPSFAKYLSLVSYYMGIIILAYLKKEGRHANRIERKTNLLEL